jgi:hypothetical protein
MVSGDVVRLVEEYVENCNDESILNDLNNPLDDLSCEFVLDNVDQCKNSVRDVGNDILESVLIARHSCVNTHSSKSTSNS